MTIELKKQFLDELSSYLKYLNHLLTSSLKIKDLAVKNELDALDLAINNRERLLKILKVYKIKIENKLDKKDRLNLGPEFFENFAKIEQDIHVFFQFIKRIDEQVIGDLSAERNEMAKKISKFSKIKSYLKSI